MDESSGRRGGGIIATILVLMALASLQGVSTLVSDNTDPTRGEVPAPEGPAGPAEPAPSDPIAELIPSPEPSPAPTVEAEPDDGVDVAGERFIRLSRPYPKSCLRGVDRPVPGKLASFQGGRVSISAPGSSSAVRFEGHAPIAWSPSGKYIAIGSGDLFRPNGKGAGRLSKAGSKLWAWSSVSDCAVAVGDSGMTLYGRSFGERRLLDVAGIQDISFSPDGRRLAFVARGSQSASRRSIWISDLARGSARHVKSYSRRTPVVELLGWTADSRHLFYGAAAGESIAADGVPLRFVSARGQQGGRAGAIVLVEDSFITHCAGRELVVAGGGRDANVNKRLAYLTSSGPSYITPTSAVVMSPSCSPDGGFIATVAAADGADISTRRLALLRSDGSFERFLAPEGSGDEYPVWGPRGTGLSFIRLRPSGKLADVWFIPEGGSARPTPLALAVPPINHGTYAWPQVFDWSATP